MFDGHGGVHCSKFAAQFLPHEVQRALRSLEEEARLNAENSLTVLRIAANALRQAMESLDKLYVKFKTEMPRRLRAHAAVLLAALSSAVAGPVFQDYLLPQVQYAATFKHTLELRYDGTVWASGRNDFGQLADLSTVNRDQPVQVFDQATGVSAGGSHSLFLRKDNYSFAAGRNEFGQLGDGTRKSRNFPKQISFNVKAVAAGGDHSILLMVDGTVQTVGRNDYGQLCDGTKTHRVRLFPVMKGVKAIAAGGYHSIFLMNDDTVYTCGRNDLGQLGDASTLERLLPNQVMDNVRTISGAEFASFFVLMDSTLIAAGQFESGLPRNRANWTTLQYFSAEEVQQMTAIIG